MEDEEGVRVIRENSSFLYRERRMGVDIGVNPKKSNIHYKKNLISI